MDSASGNHSLEHQAFDRDESNADTRTSEFYGNAQKYWSTIPATVNGMLGGLGYISSIDIEGSSQFLNDLDKIGNQYALDCGAGIGRITKNLLMPRFAKVDLVEQDASFAQTAATYCVPDVNAQNPDSSRLGEIFNVGLQDFCPDALKYDLIWCQWVLGHLTDADLLTFFRRVRTGLAKGAYFVLKENVTSGKETEKDDTDSSVTRTQKSYEKFLRRAGFRIVKITQQRRLPKGLYPVYMIACQSDS